MRQWTVSGEKFAFFFPPPPAMQSVQVLKASHSVQRGTARFWRRCKKPNLKHLIYYILKEPSVWLCVLTQTHQTSRCGGINQIIILLLTYRNWSMLIPNYKLEKVPSLCVCSVCPLGGLIQQLFKLNLWLQARLENNSSTTHHKLQSCGVYWFSLLLSWFFELVSWQLLSDWELWAGSIAEFSPNHLWGRNRDVSIQVSNSSSELMDAKFEEKKKKQIWCLIFCLISWFLQIWLISKP